MSCSDICIDGLQELLSTIFQDEALISYLAQMLCDEGTDADAAWEILETFLLDAEVPGPTCRAVRMQLDLIVPSSQHVFEPHPLEKAIIMSDLLCDKVAKSPTSDKLAPSRTEKAQAKSRKIKVDNFDVQRHKFLKQHERLIRENISDCFSGDLQLLAPPLSEDVKMRFMDGFGHGRRRRWIPVLHGTDASNHGSIFERGLLIPGQGNELEVVHGAAHGRGIYTAGLHASWLSRGFCSEPRMLVCAVFVGGDLRYARDAIVVRNCKHVVPLFEAVWTDELLAGSV
jgi:hypothetical protein